jgi:hypothetical protein
MLNAQYNIKISLEMQSPSRHLLWLNVIAFIRTKRTDDHVEDKRSTCRSCTH